MKPQNNKTTNQQKNSTMVEKGDKIKHLKRAMTK